MDKKPSQALAWKQTNPNALSNHNFLLPALIAFCSRSIRLRANPNRCNWTEPEPKTGIGSTTTTETETETETKWM